MTWFLWDSGILWPSILNLPTTPSSVAQGFALSRCMRLAGILAEEIQRREGLVYTGATRKVSKCGQISVHPEKEICLLRRERNEPFWQGKHITRDPLKQEHILEWHWGNKLALKPTSLHFSLVTWWSIKVIHQICSRNYYNLSSAINCAGGKMMLIFSHQVSQLFWTPKGSRAVWILQCGHQLLKPRIDNSTSSFRGQSPQGVARADLRKKLCSIGNELWWWNEEALLAGLRCDGFELPMNV